MDVQVCVWYGILIVIGGEELGVYQVVWALLYHLVQVVDKITSGQCKLNCP